MKYLLPGFMACLVAVAIGVYSLMLSAVILSLFFLIQGIITLILVEKGFICNTKANELLAVGATTLGFFGLASLFIFS